MGEIAQASAARAPKGTLGRRRPSVTNGVPDSYEKLKELTRGKGGVTKDTLYKFIDNLALPEAEKKRLREMTPQNYLGAAVALTRKI